MPIWDDIEQKSSYNMFASLNFGYVMHGLRFFDIQKIKKEYLMANKEIRNLVEKNIKDHEEDVSLQIKLGNSISHKEFIKTVRNNYFA